MTNKPKNGISKKESESLPEEATAVEDLPAGDGSGRRGQKQGTDEEDGESPEEITDVSDPVAAKAEDNDNVSSESPTVVGGPSLNQNVKIPGLRPLETSDADFGPPPDEPTVVGGPLLDRDGSNIIQLTGKTPISTLPPPEGAESDSSTDTTDEIENPGGDADVRTREVDTQAIFKAQEAETRLIDASAVSLPEDTDQTKLAPLEATIVSFDSVTKTYGEGKSAFTAIKDLNFEVKNLPGKGEFVSILGPSGCGKSTVLRLIAGLSPQHPATAGKVLVLGKPVVGPGADRGMVFQDYTSFNHLTVLENVAFGLACRGESKRHRNKQAADWIDRVGLSVKDDADKYPHELSGGMRQRVAIARTLALRPKIILMDEPFGALDPSTRMHMQDLLVSLWRELQATVFFVTHSIEEAVYLGDRIHILSSSPGTMLREVVVPPPNRPAKEMQKQAKFLEYVFDIRDTIETLESSQRGGDD